MSKGLGSLQTNILGMMLATPGGDEISWHRGIRLADGYHDMRRISRAMLRAQGEQFAGFKWCASFSRAVRTLEIGGVIQFPNMVPLASTPESEYGENGIIRCSDGTYLFAGKTRRFCRVLVEIDKMLNAYYQGQRLVEQILEETRHRNARLDAARTMLVGIMAKHIVP